MELSAGTDPEMDDGGSQQDPDTMHQISHHVDESRLHAGVGVAVTVAVVLMLFVPLRPARTAVTVAMWGTRLMEDQGHPTYSKVQTQAYDTQNNPSLDLELLVLTGCWPPQRNLRLWAWSDCWCCNRHQWPSEWPIWPALQSQPRWTQPTHTCPESLLNITDDRPVNMESVYNPIWACKSNVNLW